MLFDGEASVDSCLGVALGSDWSDVVRWGGSSCAVTLATSSLLTARVRAGLSPSSGCKFTMFEFLRVADPEAPAASASATVAEASAEKPPTPPSDS